MKKLFRYDYCKEEFSAVGEDLAMDLSGITMNIFKNVHDGSIELLVEMFGREGIDGVAVLSETVCNPEDYMRKEIDPSKVLLQNVLELFEDTLINLMVEKKLTIIFNRGWQTETFIVMDNIDKKSKITIEEQ